MSVPETRYAKTSDDVHIAYQVLGQGPIDLVIVAWALGLGEIWRSPLSAPFFRPFATFSRLILLDRRGTGLSDHVLDREQQTTLENRMEDIRAVMDAVGSERAILMGIEEGGFPVAAMFAATLPERTAGLIALGAGARATWTPDYPWGMTPAEYDAETQEIETGWGTRELAKTWADVVYPDDVDDPEVIEAFATWMRAVGGPGDAASWHRDARDTDIRDLLPTIRVPTLVLHREDDLAVPFEHGRYLAENIPGAELVALPGTRHGWKADEDVATAVERFVTTLHREEAELDRVLATVMFTDIVDSTKKASELGDRSWSELVEQHHAIVRGLLARYRGVEVDTAGDGFFATFDGPARGIRCAQAIVEEVPGLGIQIRAGLHTGEVETIDGKAGGIAVNIGARVGAHAGPSQVVVSQTVKDLVAGGGFVFEDAGEHELKGIPDRWRLYRVTG